MHLSRLSLIDLLNLPVLIPDNRDVLLGEACLFSELLLEGQRLIYIVLLCLSFSFLCGEGGLTNLLTHGRILLSDLL